MWIVDIAAVILGYLLGSLPFAHAITRWRTGLCIREVGEGNVGARNVWHVVGPTWGFLVFLLDGSKGAAAVLLARYGLGASLTGQLLAGPAAVIGHAFPLFLRFQGGKGVSTVTGVLMAWAPWSTLTGLGLFGLAQLFLRDFNKSVVIGVVPGILLPMAFGYHWTMSLYFLALFLSLALKKQLDLAHERRVFARSGWKDGARPGWYREAGAEEPAGHLIEGRKGGDDLPDCGHDALAHCTGQPGEQPAAVPGSSPGGTAP